MAESNKKKKGDIGAWFKESFSVEPKQAVMVAKNGIIGQNPVLVLLLGMCSTLAITTSITNAIGMGLATTAVLTMSNLFISLLRNIIPANVRIASFVVVIAGFVTIVDLVIQAYLDALSQSLGIFIPLIVVNCIILARAEAFAFKNTPGYSILDGLFMGLGFTLALCIMSTIREFIGSGSFAGVQLLGENYPGVAIMTSAPGGFITLGCVIGLVQFIRSKTEGRDKK